MKKHVSMILVLVLMLTAAACSNNRNALSQIYEVDSGSLFYDTFTHENVISDDVVYSQEFPEGQAKTIQVNGESWTGTYKCTVYYPVSDRKAHQYLIGGTEECSVLFNEDGSLYGIAGEFALLNISKTDSSETVRAALEKEIADIVDLSKYQYVDVEDHGDENDFKRYKFVFRNEVHGYRSDFAKVCVDSDGTVFALWINDLLLNAEQHCEGIDKEIEKNLISDRLKSIFNTDTVEYRGYSFLWTPGFQVYENELFVQYMLIVNLYDKDLHGEGTEGERTGSCELLIPARLLTEG